MDGDDWRGEHLIRGIRGDGHDGGRYNIKPKKDVSEVCGEPDCSIHLGRGNTTGFCIKHFQRRRRYLKG